MLENLSFKQKIIFFIILSIMICFIIYYIYTNLSSEDDTDLLLDNSLNTNYYKNDIYNESTLSITTQNTRSIIVYICGCVNENKNVTLHEGSRVLDAIEAAGGLTNDADLTNINLAYILEDGEKIYIPHKNEKKEDYPSDISSYISSNSKTTTKTNINKASQAELELVPGIGPSTALKIINYRKENGNFKKIEDIKNVSGIGDLKYEQMKNYISVK